MVQIKYFDLEGQRVKVTHEVPEKFYGIYRGAKSGYLKLNEDGSGEYQYDVFGFHTTDCEPGVIRMEWGMLLDEHDELVFFEREYGFSYPVIYRCKGNPCFNGCRRTYMVDYLLDKGNGSLSVSSTDDWAKNGD